MSVQPFVLRTDQHESALHVVGTQVTVLASNAATHSDGITFSCIGGDFPPRPSGDAVFTMNIPEAAPIVQENISIGIAGLF